jgi:phthalate 4,5-dioxygenase reductase subunit
MAALPGSPLPQPLNVAVASKAEIADDIFMFVLHPVGDDVLPRFTPGAHVTIVTPLGQRRRYSCCNDPAERHHYVIAVKREKYGRGGSLSLTTEINAGDIVSIVEIGNDFPLAGTHPKGAIFIAGGIGITPIRSMILHLASVAQDNLSLYYLSRTPSAMAYREDFLAMNNNIKVNLHYDGGNLDNSLDLWPVLENQRGRHLYCCGPAALMDSVRDMTGHWSKSAVHFEDFVGASAHRVEDTPFRVRLGRSDETLEVPVGMTILEVLRKSGRDCASSCESGTCGTCRTRYLDGTPDHRDFVLSEEERKTELMICVSRASTPEITIDL